MLSYTASIHAHTAKTKRLLTVVNVQSEKCLKFAAWKFEHQPKLKILTWHLTETVQLSVSEVRKM